MREGVGTTTLDITTKPGQPVPSVPPKVGVKPPSIRNSISGSNLSLNIVNDSSKKPSIATALNNALSNIAEKPLLKSPTAAASTVPPPPSSQAKPNVSRKPSIALAGGMLSRSPSSAGIALVGSPTSVLATAGPATPLQFHVPLEAGKDQSAGDAAGKIATMQSTLNQLVDTVYQLSDTVQRLATTSKPGALSDTPSPISAIHWNEFTSTVISKLDHMLETRLARQMALIEQLLGNGHTGAPEFSRSNSITCQGTVTAPSGLSTSSRPQQSSPGSSNRPHMVRSPTRDSIDAAVNGTEASTDAAEDFKTIQLKKPNRNSIAMPQQEAQQLAGQIASELTMVKSKSMAILKPAASSPDGSTEEKPSASDVSTVKQPSFAKRNSITGGLSGLFGRSHSPSTAGTVSQASVSVNSSQVLFNSSLRGFNGLPANLDASVSDPHKRVHQSAIYEIIHTERDYFKDMELLVEYRALAINTFQIDSDTAQSIFGQTETLLAASKYLLGKLEAKSDKSENQLVEHVGDVFLEVCPKLDVYVEYCANQKCAVAKLHEVEQTPQWKKLLEQFRMDNRAFGFTLETFLLKPVQRICKYPMLLSEVLKHTDENSEDIPNLSKAIDFTKTLLGYINEETRSKEIVEQFATHLTLIDGGEFLKLKERRGLLMGYLQINSSFTSKDRFVMLFDDLLIVLKPVKNRYQVESSYNIADTLVHEKTDSRKSFKLIIYNSVTEKRETISMQCATEGDRRLWVNAISLAISALGRTSQNSGLAKETETNLNSNYGARQSTLSIADMSGVTVESNVDLSLGGRVKNMSQTFEKGCAPNAAQQSMHPLQRSGSAYASSSHVRASTNNISSGNSFQNTSPGTIGSISNITAMLNPRLKPLLASMNTDAASSSSSYINFSQATQSTSDLSSAPKQRQRATTITSYIPEKAVLKT